MKILIVTPLDKPILCHDHVSRAFRESFQSLGHDSVVSPEYVSGYDVCLVMHTFIQYGFPKDKTYKIACNWESLLDHQWHRRIHRAIDQFNCLWECSLDNLKVSLPIRQMYCPLGYHPSFEIPVEAGKNSESVVFIGATFVSNHRKEVIQGVERSGLRVWHIDSVDNCIYGKELDQKIIGSLVCLNIHRNPKLPMFESHRVITKLISNKCFVISEASYDSPLTDKRHYVETNNFSRDIKHYLEHPEERKMISQQGYDFVKNNYRLVDFIGECLNRL